MRSSVAGPCSPSARGRAESLPSGRSAMMKTGMRSGRLISITYPLPEVLVVLEKLPPALGSVLIDPLADAANCGCVWAAHERVTELDEVISTCLLVPHATAPAPSRRIPENYKASPYKPVSRS